MSEPRIVSECHTCEGPLLMIGGPPVMGGLVGRNMYGTWVHLDANGQPDTEIDRTDHDADPIDDGKEDCRECTRIGDGFGPPHDASPKCESGGRDHCTCDTCF